MKIFYWYICVPIGFYKIFFIWLYTCVPIVAKGLNTKLHCCWSKTNNARITGAELLRQHLLEELHDVFESQPPMKGERFNIVLKKNAVLCCVSKAQSIPVAYQQALRNELDKLLCEGIITPVTEATQWVNPIVVEPKCDHNGQYNGRIKLCVAIIKPNLQKKVKI